MGGKVGGTVAEHLDSTGVPGVCKHKTHRTLIAECCLRFMPCYEISFIYSVQAQKVSIYGSFTGSDCTTGEECKV